MHLTSNKAKRAKLATAEENAVKFNTTTRISASEKDPSSEDAARTNTLLVRFEPSAAAADAAAAKPATAFEQALDIDANATPAQMESLVNTLLGNKDRIPFAFYLSSDAEKEGPREITATLKESAEEMGLSTNESVLRVSYEPLSRFRVNTVTRCTDSLPGHSEAILHVQFSPDGASLASGGGDTTVRFWDISTNTPKFICRGHKNHVLCTSWSPDGTRFISGDKSGEIKVWNPNTGADVFGSTNVKLKHAKWVTSLSWEPAHVASATNPRFVSGSKDKTARVWSASTGKCEAILTHHEDSVESVAWGGEGLLYTASRDRSVVCWFEDKKELGHFKIARVLLGHAHRINAIALSTQHLLRGATTREERGTTPAQRYEKARATQMNNPELPFERLVTCSDDFTLFLWFPTLDKKPVARLTGHVQAVTHLCFSPDSRYIASASFDKKIKLWDGRTGRFLRTLNGHVGAVYQVCWSPDSRLLCSASKDSTVKLWMMEAAETDKDKARHTLAGHADEVYALDWSPDGGMLASGSKDRLVKIWKN